MRSDQDKSGTGVRQAANSFDELVSPHLGDALALARWLTGSLHDAEDVVQEACIRALAALNSYEGRGAKPWLLAIVRNTCFTWLSKNRLKDIVLVGTMSDVDEVQGTEREVAPSPEAALIRKADIAAVQSALQAVAHPFREILILRDVNELTYKEIASMLDIPIGTVMSRLARGRALLAAQLTKVG